LEKEEEEGEGRMNEGRIDERRKIDLNRRRV
jgi:hypothetical protein